MFTVALEWMYDTLPMEKFGELIQQESTGK